MASFTRFNFHAGERERRSLRPHEIGAPPDLPGFGAAAAEMADAAESITFHNDESAARHYLDALWVPEEEGPLFDITAPESPAVVPDLRLGSVQESPSTNTRLMHFDQRVDNVRVLGAKAVVELSPDRGLVSINAQIAGSPDVSPIATLSASDALAKVAEKAGVAVEALGAVSAPSLTYYQGDEAGWHLVYEVRHIPVAPAEFLQALEEEPGHGLGASPRQETFDMTYLVDAHDGAVVVYFSEVPLIIDLPVQCQGLDELQTVQHFFGFQNGAAFELRDPLRKIRTLDMGFGNLMTAPAPTSPVSHTAFDFQSINTAAVSAHVNAQRVFDFYNDTLKRDGVDDKGMELVSVVNCTYKPPGTQSWKNAVWYKQQMWYGQVSNAAGGFDSYSRYLDVIAHELTHGVTETTAGLKYLNESGALNESFSDIFGIMVKNLNGPHPGDPDLWDWELGAGLSASGGPLRDLSDPTRTGDPDHMTKYQHKPSWDDGGGVHTNSNIHNKAAFNVLTAKDANGSHHFAPTQAALLYYLTLTRLSAFATFSDVLATMQNVIRTFWAGQSATAQEKVDAVVAAYASVGIT